MAVRSITPPTTSGRRSRFQYTEQEIKESIKLLEDGGTPGDGPFDTMKEARSRAQALKRQVEDVAEFEGDTVLGTQAWLDNKDKAHFLIKVR